MEQKCVSQNTARVSDIQQNEFLVFNKHNTDVGNEASKQVNTLYFGFNYCIKYG